MTLFYHFSIFLHLIAATIWIGGSLFLVLMIVPLLRDPQIKPLMGGIVQMLAIRFRFWGWICMAVFFVTGGLNLYFRAGTLAILFMPQFWRTPPLGHLLAGKLIVFGLILLLSAIHDFYIGPRAARSMQQDPNSPSTLKFRKQAAWFGRVNLLLGLLMMIFGIMIVRGTPW